MGMAPAWFTVGRAAAKAALGTLVAVYIVGTVHFVDHACENVAHVLPQEIVGQELALTHLTDSVCHHIAQKKPQRPLVISVHGPPGVGKTYTHLWLARTMYNKKPSTDLDCPGIHCRGYKVLYGMDFLQNQAEERLDAVRREVISHLTAAPDALLVIEEYDKLDCATRGLWRQLLQHPEVANITSHRAVILMESNVGMTELKELITRVGDSSKVTMQEAEALLRDVVFDEWTKAACEDYTDTLKFMNLIDVFLPYLPLGRQHMGQLAELGLQQRRHYLARQRIHLTWQPGVVDFVAGKVVYNGEYPLDGAKVVETALRHTVSGLIRLASQKPGCKASHGCSLHLAEHSHDQLKVLVANNTAKGLPPRQPVQQQAVVLTHAQQQQQRQQTQPAWRQPPLPGSDEL